MPGVKQTSIYLRDAHKALQQRCPELMEGISEKTMRKIFKEIGLSLREKLMKTGYIRIHRLGTIYIKCRDISFRPNAIDYYTSSADYWKTGKWENRYLHQKYLYGIGFYSARKAPDRCVWFRFKADGQTRQILSHLINDGDPPPVYLTPEQEHNGIYID